MNREIKFRAWDYQNNKWANKHGEVEDSIGLEFGVNDWFINIAGERALRWSFCQYTGLKDKNGNEIYEGDIVKYHGAVGVVFYDNDTAMYMINFKLHRSNYSFNSIEEPVEIIGNIYQTPGLLK